MKTINKNIFVPIIILIVSVVVALFYSLNLALLIISIGVLYKILDSMLGRTIFSSLLLRIFTAVFVYMILLQCIILASWAISSNFSLSADIPIAFLITLILYIVGDKIPVQKFTKEPTPIVNRFDIIAIALSLLIAVPMMAQSLKPDDTKTGSPFQLLASGSDDPWHLKMFDVRIKYDRGILEQSDAGDRAYSIDTYPAGWHSANAAVVKAIYPNISVGTNTQTAYTIVNLFWFFALLILFSRVTILLYRIIVKDKSSLLATTWLLLSLYVFGRAVVANVYPAGAFSFVPQLIGVLLSLLIILQISLKESSALTRDSIFLLTITAIGGCLSWVLVMPALFVSVVAVIIIYMLSTPSATIIRQLLTKPTYCIPLYLLLAASLVQIYVMMTSHSPGALSFIDGINQRAGVMTHDVIFYLFLITGFITCMLLLYAKFRTFSKYIIWLIIPLFLFDQIIAILQLLTIGENRYFVFKVLNLINMILLPLCIAGFAAILHGLTSRYRIPGLIAWIALTIISVQFLARLLLYL